MPEVDAFGFGGFEGVDLGLDLLVEFLGSGAEERGIEVVIWVEDVADPHCTVHAFAGGGEDLDEEIVGLFAVVEAGAELFELVFELGIGEGSHLRLELADGFDAGGVAFDDSFVS